MKFYISFEYVNVRMFVVFFKWINWKNYVGKVVLELINYNGVKVMISLCRFILIIEIWVKNVKKC